MNSASRLNPLQWLSTNHICMVFLTNELKMNDKNVLQRFCEQSFYVSEYIKDYFQFAYFSYDF